MPEVRIFQTDKTIHCEKGSNLLKVLQEADISVNNACNGKGTCGKCKVGIRKLKEPSERQIVLSCLETIFEDVEIELFSEEKEHKVLTKGWMPDFQKDDFSDGYGLAIDIGTTTVVVSLVDLPTGNILAEAAALNAQKKFGMDVLTRITYEYENPEQGKSDLQKAIVESLNQMIQDICKEAKVSEKEIVEIVVAANCTMTHMLLGVDARSIGKSPYQPQFLDSKTLYAKEIGICADEQTILYCLPQVSGYIGADIVAGTYISELEKEKGNVLFIDIGTNGEIVLASNGKLLCCSCAAGPALEGMNISSGMRAADGAIENVIISKDGIEIEVIGNSSPQGLCGSGILAVVRELLKTGIVKSSGAFIKKESLDEQDYRHPLIQMNGSKRELVLSENPKIIVTQGDVRQVQLAKGAILSGFIALLNKANIEMKDLKKVYIAGQFGAHLSKDLLTGVGILPKELEERLVYIGNSSKTGAYMALMSSNSKCEMEKLAKKMDYMELAETENYEKIFSQAMIFPSY